MKSLVIASWTSFNLKISAVPVFSFRSGGEHISTRGSEVKLGLRSSTACVAFCAFGGVMSVMSAQNISSYFLYYCILIADLLCPCDCRILSDTTP